MLKSTREHFSGLLREAQVRNLFRDLWEGTFLYVLYCGFLSKYNFIPFHNHRQLHPHSPPPPSSITAFPLVYFLQSFVSGLRMEVISSSSPM